MSAEENKAFIREYFAALSGKDKPASVVNRYVGDSDEALKQHIAGSEVAFPHYELIAEDMIAEGDKVAVRALLRAVNSGPFMGMPPTGKQVTVPGWLIYRVANGKIVEHWMLFDSMSLMQQLGALPQPQAA
jgi:predicted ester cyclase